MLNVVMALYFLPSFFPSIIILVLTTTILTSIHTTKSKQSSATGLLLYRLTGKDVYRDDFMAYMKTWSKRPKTPKGAYIITSQRNTIPILPSSW